MHAAYVPRVSEPVMLEDTAPEQVQQDSPAAPVELVSGTLPEPPVYDPFWHDDLPAKTHPEYTVKYYDFQEGDYKPASWRSDATELPGHASRVRRKNR